METRIKTSLVEYIHDTSGQDILACYQCLKCTAGCPVAAFMEFPPNAIHRMIQNDRRKEILDSGSIWLCTGCETCGTRCPNDINSAKVMDSLKQLVVKEKHKTREKKIWTMHTVFLSGIQKRGRMHELSLIRDMRLRSGGYFKDMKLAITMFRLGKLTIIPEKVKGIKRVRALFRKARRDQ